MSINPEDQTTSDNSIDLLAKQPNESGPRIMTVRPPQDGEPPKYPPCFACHKPIEPGQEFYQIANNKYVRRHTTCSRISPGPLKETADKPPPNGGSFHSRGGRVIRGVDSLP